MRQTWREYFMDIARVVATRSTCTRKKVGAVIVKDKNILTTGYNGSISGTEHCEDVGCMIKNGSCIRTIHAEQNAIAFAAKNGINLLNAEIYVTCSPCWPCFKLLVNSGVYRIYYDEEYHDKMVLEEVKKTGVILCHYLKD
jgi:dCMP deaminase